MKPGKPLKRRKPLKATPFKSAPVMTPNRTTGLKPGGPIERKTPLKAVSDKRRRDNAYRAVVVSAMQLATSGECARCGRRDAPVHGHERLGRAQGGDILQPDCLLCPECNGWCEDEPRIAAWTGWKISSKWPHDHTLTSSQAWALDGSIVEFTTTDAEVA